MGLNTVTQSVLVATLVTAVSYFGTILYKKWKKVKIPSSWEKVGNVKKLHLYPLKSGHRIELEKAEVTDFGLKQTQEDEKVFQLRDRGLIVYGAKDNEFRTARTYPKMVSIDVAVHDENHLAIDAPSMRTLYVKIPNRADNSIVSIKCCDNERIQGIDCGDDAASWFSHYIIEKESGLRLAFNDASERRDITTAQAKIINYYKHLTNESTGLFSDLSSMSLINIPSVNDLNKRVSNCVIPAEQFRHNIIVDGPDMEPYEEDKWDWVKVGDDVVLRNVKDCTRCVATTVNPENGVRNPQREPLKTLQQCWDNEKIQGIDCGDEAASWLSRYIIERESGLRLAYNDASQRRDITKTHQKLLNYYKNLTNQSTGLFSDLSSVSLINIPSVNDLNKRVGNSVITAEQFRHNIIVDGPDMEPYEEDNWDWIKVGDNVVLRNVKDCTRCVMTTINPENGVRNPDREPLKTLQQYRKHSGPEDSPRMGLNLEVQRTGFIKVGDPVYVSRKEKASQ